MLTADQQAGFAALGFVRLPGAFAAPDAAAMCARVLAELGRRYGIVRDDPATWPREQPRGLRRPKRDAAFAAVVSPVVEAALDDLLGRGVWLRPRAFGVPLASRPCPGATWDVPCSGWHLDWPGSGAAHPLFGVKVLAFLSPVAPCGGGTLLLAGSHHLVTRLVEASPRSVSSQQARRALARSIRRTPERRPARRSGCRA